MVTVASPFVDELLYTSRHRMTHFLYSERLVVRWGLEDILSLNPRNGLRIIPVVILLLRITQTVLDIIVSLPSVS